MDARDDAGGWRLYWDSGVSQNTIVVDGMAAARRTGDYSQLDAMRWHTCTIDFMETEIRGPYKGPDFRRDGRAYAADEVVVELATGHGCRIATVQPGAPNLSLFQLGPPGLAYEKHTGVYDEHRIPGWVGILADRDTWTYTPAVNVHANWRGEGAMLLVTLLVPHEDVGGGVTIDDVETDEARGVRGFDATLIDGHRLSCRMATSPTAIEALGVQASGSSLVVLRAADGRITGTALDADTFEGQPAGQRNFEFVFPGSQQPAQSTPIECPTEFRWSESATGLRPAYSPPPGPGPATIRSRRIRRGDFA